MNNEDLILRIAARCEAAGRPNNEDNYQISENLTDSQWGFTTDKEITLGEKGTLLVVCDGMGGMNAGEVASAIAVQTIKERFAAEKLSEKVTSSSASIQRFIVEAIQAADESIKKEGKENAEHEGMGSTIVLAWLIGKKVYVGWCGDSRAYCYNPHTGLRRLSHDHSYVQELVDAGKLTEELAFDHPNNNIITRSLGDTRGKAQPDVKEYELCNEDIILLCSDGLCGCLRDNEIEEVIKQHQTSMQECRDSLWIADEAAGWHDNVTIVLAQVIAGGAEVKVAMPNDDSKLSNSKVKWKRTSFILGGFVVVLLVILTIVVLVVLKDKGSNNGMDALPTVESVSQSGRNLSRLGDATQGEEYSGDGEDRASSSNNLSLEVEPSSLEVSNGRHFKKIFISTSCASGYDCTIPDSVQWCRIHQKGSNFVELEIEKNFSDSRTTMVTIKAGNQEKKIKVVQSAGSNNSLEKDTSAVTDTIS